MAEIFRICNDVKLYIGSLAFEKREILPVCDLECMIPKDSYSCILDDDAVLYAQKTEIGTEPHPFIELCEAAYYKDGAWVLGIDRKQNRYFTPVFTNG